MNIYKRCIATIILTSLAMSFASVCAAGPDIDVTIDTAPGIAIAGALRLPDSFADGSPLGAPVVIMVSGSGKQNRDADNMVPGYAPNRDWATHLAQRGVASFRYDERGAGGSSGDWAAMTIQEHAADLAAILGYLRQRPEVDPDRILIMGHSEGSILATMTAASEGANLAGLILLAGPAWEMDRVLDYQARVQTRAAGQSPGELAAAAAATRAAFVSRIRHIPNLNSLFGVDPLHWARLAKAPLLIIQGGADEQVLPEQAGELARAAIQGGADDVTLRVYPGVDHMLTAFPSTDSVSRAIHPDIVADVLGWIGPRTRDTKSDNHPPS